ncbi:unnamed protein product [Polarella glacialis]|uniref:SGNH hydrolase-type esterase domain-containing protein n=1 Tax=Polarella glacialis TaxID=89957 RepID=A0A813KT45_POLGL|nr:unnamed protein product [Polarella glacialis]
MLGCAFCNSNSEILRLPRSAGIAWRTWAGDWSLGFAKGDLLFYCCCFLLLVLLLVLLVVLLVLVLVLLLVLLLVVYFNVIYTLSNYKEHGLGDALRECAVQGAVGQVFLLIGTNDLARKGVAPDSPTSLSSELQTLVRELTGYLKGAPVLVQALLPRAKKGPGNVCLGWGSDLCPGPNCSELYEAVEATNREIQKMASRFRSEGLHVTAVDCNAVFLRDGRLNEGLFYDRLHPNSEGYKRWALCLQEARGTLEKS